MSGCDLDVVLYFYDEMDAVDRVRAAGHLRECEACRQRLDELHAIRRALADRPHVDAPPAGDWSGFMRRLDLAVQPSRSAPRPAASGQKHAPPQSEPRAVLEFNRGRWSVRHVASLAAMLAVVVIGVFMAARFAAKDPADRRVTVAPNVVPQPEAPVPPAAIASAANQSLREGSAEHLERSKLVVLGLVTRDPDTRSEDWQYERRLAGTLLADTRLYRMAAQDRGVSDVARVMRDLETVLLEASLSDTADPQALERVQNLIAKRDLVVKMQVVATAGSAGI
jgi:hypothetical protein